MVSFDTTPQSTKYVNSLLAVESTMLVMDGLIPAKPPEEPKVYLRKETSGYDTGKYVEETYTVSQKYEMGGQILLEIASTQTSEVYYISESLFELHYRELQS